jgi:hypothetical protein
MDAIKSLGGLRSSENWRYSLRAAGHSWHLLSLPVISRDLVSHLAQTNARFCQGRPNGYKYSNIAVAAVSAGVSRMAERLSDFIHARRWVNEQGASVFPSFASLEWFIRHQWEVVQSGQHTVRRVSSGTLIGPEFGNLVLDILRRESRKAVASEAA